MCKTAVAFAFTVVVLTLRGLFTPVAAQEPEARDRAERLYERLEMVNARAALAEQLQLQVALDTTALGFLTLITLLDDQRRIRETVGELRSAMRELLAGDSISRDPVTVIVVPVSANLGGLGGLQYWYGENTEATEITTGIVQQVRAALWQRQGEILFRWLRSPPETDTLGSIRAEVTYAELATTPWSVVRSCYQRNLQACEDALGVRMTQDSLSRWYTGSELKTIVTPGSDFRLAMYRPRYMRLPEYEDCLSSASKDACLSVVEAEPWLARAPLSTTARMSLVGVALEVGGEGAFGRLTASDGDPLDRLSVAAGVHGDSLIAIWHGRIMEARPTATQLTRPSAWAAFLWVLVAVTLATRSTRWRTA